MTPAFLPRSLLQFAARLLVALLLFAQGVMLAHACTVAERGAAFTAAVEAVPAPCHEQAADATAAAPTEDRASCLSHCSTVDQSADTPQVVVFAMPMVALLKVPVAADLLALGRASVAAPPHTGDPPIAIRFQVFLS